MAQSDLFPGFRTADVETPIGTIHMRIGGEGPPVVFLHGFPQTHVCWHRVAPTFAADRQVVCMDLRGYGASVAPHGDGRTTYAKRAMAVDVVEAMAALGHDRFSVVGHDRGARVGYRLALDHPARVERLALLDIVPTVSVWEQIRAGTFASPHWEFLARPFPEPEEEIGKDPAAYFEGLLSRWSFGGTLDGFDPRALAAYRTSFLQPDRIHAACEDYRAGATTDREADEADLRHGRTIACPALVVWSDYLTRNASGAVETPPQTWRRTFCPQITDVRLRSGHFLAEEDPDETIAALRLFLK